MSRRRPKGRFDYEYVAVDIECPKGHLVGHAMKILGGPHAGRYATGRGVRFEDSPDITDVSGRVRGTCSRCGADVIARWAVVRERIESNLAIGRHTDTMRP